MGGWGEIELGGLGMCEYEKRMGAIELGGLLICVYKK